MKVIVAMFNNFEYEFLPGNYAIGFIADHDPRIQSLILCIKEMDTPGVTIALVIYTKNTCAADKAAEEMEVGPPKSVTWIQASNHAMVRKSKAWVLSDCESQDSILARYAL
jgi:hypothetical protein